MHYTTLQASKTRYRCNVHLYRHTSTVEGAQNEDSLDALQKSHLNVRTSFRSQRVPLTLPAVIGVRSASQVGASCRHIPRVRYLHSQLPVLTPFNLLLHICILLPAAIVVSYCAIVLYEPRTCPRLVREASSQRHLSQ